MNLLEYFPNEVVVTDQTINISNFSLQWKEGVVKLAETIYETYQKSDKGRFIVVLAGAGGSSKSTTAAVLEHLLKNIQAGVLVLNVGQDGYHFPQEYLDKTNDLDGQPLSSHKGRYDTIDFTHMQQDLNLFTRGEDVYFPVYSRKIHNPINQAITCQEKSCLLILEGGWLLYNQAPWNELLPLYDFTVFMHAPADALKQNVIERHIRGGKYSPEEAGLFYEKSDAESTKLIINNIAVHDYDFYQ